MPRSSRGNEHERAADQDGGRSRHLLADRRLRRDATLLAVAVVSVSVGFGVIWGFQSMVVFVFAAGAVLGAAGAAAYALRRGDGPPSEPDPTAELPDAVDNDASLVWEGLETGPVRWLPADTWWYVAVSLALPASNLTVVQLANAGAGAVVVLPGAALMFWLLWLVNRRHLRSMRAPVPVALRDDGMLLVAEAFEHPAAVVPVQPSYVVASHRDGTVSVAFGDLGPIACRLLGEVAGSFPDSRWLRRRLSRLDLLLVGVEPGGQFVLEVSADGP